MKRTFFRNIIIIIALAFIALGINNGEEELVMRKAIMICLECVGIG